LNIIKAVPQHGERVMASWCRRALRHAPAIWAEKSTGTTGPISAQILSMSQLLRWKWKSEKSIATGTHNSELPSARLSCHGPIILDGGRRRAVGSRRPMNGAPGGQHFCSGREPSGLPALWGREKAPPPVGRGLNIIMQSCGSPLSRKLLPQRDNSGRKEWFQKERPRRSGAKCIAEEGSLSSADGQFRRRGAVPPAASACHQSVAVEQRMSAAGKKSPAEAGLATPSFGVFGQPLGDSGECSGPSMSP